VPLCLREPLGHLHEEVQRLLGLEAALGFSSANCVSVPPLTYSMTK
jgi:hypothetical protein